MTGASARSTAPISQPVSLTEQATYRHWRFSDQDPFLDERHDPQDPDCRCDDCSYDAYERHAELAYERSRDR